MYTGIKSLGYIWKGLQTLAQRKLEVPVLDATAIGVSILSGNYDTAGSVMFLLEIGELLEDWTHKKSVGDLARIMSLNVEKVWLKTEDGEILVPYSQIKQGDSIVVHMGNVIPFDGTVLAGEAMVNQASLTGESMPVRKSEETSVYAGTVVEEGEITVKVKAVGGSGRYDKIVTMIEDSQKLKSGLEGKAEHLADKLVPYTLAGTGLVYLATRNATKAIAVLMVDFSCALKLAMPISVLSAIREASQHNVTVKGGKYMEAVAEADTIVFDKTGTLTKAEPTVAEVVPFGGNDADEMLRMAACMEEHFPHSMAKAVVDAALKKTKFEQTPIFTGRYGLGSKDTTPAQIVAVYENTEKEKFTIGIVDDVTNLSLETGAPLVTTPEGTTNCKFWGLGADGTVGANKNSIKIIGDNTDMYAQAYFDYDSKKSGGVTMSHLRFGKKPIKSTYLIHKANFVACHNPSYVNKYNMVQELVDGGTFLLNCAWDMEGLEKHLPGQVKAFIANHNIKFYTIDGVKIGIETGMGPTRINTILQSAFFKLTGIIPEDQAIDLMKAAAKATYGRKGDDVVQKNWAAIDAGAKQVVEIQVPESWKNAEDEGLHMTHATEGRQDVVDFVNNIQAKVNAQEGNSLPVSAFKDYVDGTTPSGAAAYEKRGIAVNVPVWNPENCIQCNRCAYVCPHAVIRPVALTAEEAANAPEGMKTLDLTGMKEYKFTMSVSALDCTGCGSCVNVCPGKKGAKALAMENLEASADEQKYFDYTVKLPVKEDVIAKFKEATVKGSQFKQPLLEFSGACAGCGETPYAKLITQLFGDRMYIANATGCSSIWGNSSPSTPYTVNAKGQGPAWSNSLFEDNAEFGYGMLLAQRAIRDGLKAKVEDVVANGTNEDVKAAGQEWLDTFAVGATNGAATDKLVAALEACGCDKAKEILAQKDFLAKKSQWIFGGDGWAYDIGFGGVDHVLASGRDINVMVFDTEVYSNTGGQSSKSTPTGAIAQFAAGGKETKKKDMASIAMSYGYVYVAQISMGADFNQTVKAIAEAEAYPGPSLIIAYAPCINHGIKKGMAKAQTEEELAVKVGYWHNFRFNPAAEGNKFSLDSKAPSMEDYQAFLDGEVRYNSLKRQNPEKAARLFAKNEAEAKARFEYLQKLIALHSAE